APSSASPPSTADQCVRTLPSRSYSSSYALEDGRYPAGNGAPVGTGSAAVTSAIASRQSISHGRELVIHAPRPARVDRERERQHQNGGRRAVAAGAEWGIQVTLFGLSRFHPPSPPPAPTARRPPVQRPPMQTLSRRPRGGDPGYRGTPGCAPRAVPPSA